MGNFDSNRFKSTNQTWETPDDLFEVLNKIFSFTRDVCASSENAKCPDYWTESNSCLDKNWSGVNWMNPPYKDMKKFIKKAYDERDNAITVCLIPARTNTRWWHDWCMKGEIWFICGRPKFKGCKYGFPQPLAIVIFGRKESHLSNIQSFYLPQKQKSPS